MLPLRPIVKIMTNSTGVNKNDAGATFYWVTT